MERYREQFTGLIHRIKEYSNPVDDGLIKRAFEFSFDAHKDQLYISGEPYIEHCLKVAEILIDLKMDYETVVAGLLHAITVDTDIDKEIIKEEFGKNLYDLVIGLYQISELHFRNKHIKQTDKLRKLVLSIARDIRVIVIKLADRLIYMRAINATLEKRNSRLVKDAGEKTMAIYVPLAHRLGISKIKQDLEDLAFKFLEPKKYENIRLRLAESREERDKHIEQIVGIIKHSLSKAGILCQVHGRSKSIYSIHRKMVNRGYSFDQINDILAIRIIVKDGPGHDRFRDCYAALSVVQNEFEPVHELYSDYIQNPRDNGYQSIHAKVIYAPNSTNGRA
ncbi:HD domain-containing protein, partial [candidate division KSB1 bacterium]|nr:HD domain-containing protein [candidate division KSB1 bacterium]